MPSLFYHAGIGYVLSKLCKLPTALTVLGSVLPDFAYIVAGIVFAVTSNINTALMVALPFHTLFGSLAFALFLSFFFRPFKMVNAKALCIGAAFHMFLDNLMFPNYGMHHYYLLWPFSDQAFALNWPPELLFGIKVLIIIMFVFIGVNFLIKKVKDR